MKKYLMSVDPQTLKAHRAVTITLEDGKVTFDPESALVWHGQLSSVVVGARAISCTEGKRYFDALDTVRGSLFYIVSEDSADQRS